MKMDDLEREAVCRIRKKQRWYALYTEGKVLQKAFPPRRGTEERFSREIICCIRKNKKNESQKARSFPQPWDKLQ
jgi:hypothetical protein